MMTARHFARMGAFYFKNYRLMKSKFAVMFFLAIVMIACDKDDDMVDPVVDNTLGIFDAKFENDFNLIRYDGTARFTTSLDGDGQEFFSLMLQDSSSVKQYITTDILFSPGVTLEPGTYYFNSEEPVAGTPWVAMNLSYQNYDFDDHKDLNFGIEYTSHIVIQEVSSEVVKGYLDAHLQCDGCPILPYLITARFEAIPE